MAAQVRWWLWIRSKGTGLTPLSENEFVWPTALVHVEFA